MYACRPSLGALSLFPVTHPAVVAVPFTRPPPLAPPLPCHALYALCHVCASACPVCGMGAYGVCVVSGCGCELRVGSCGADTARWVKCSGVPCVGLSFPRTRWELGWLGAVTARPRAWGSCGCLTGNGPAHPPARAFCPPVRH